MRALKVEADGDAWGNGIKPKIRLSGKWLERAGVKPGERGRVSVRKPGVLEISALSIQAANNAQHPSWQQASLELGFDPRR